MNIQRDFEELLRLLEKNNVEYMIVGGYAVAFHGYPRFTKDIDIFFEVSQKNISALKQALLDFGFSDSDLSEELLYEIGNIITFGIAPVRIDLLNEIDGVNFASAKLNRVRGKYGNAEVFFIGKEDLKQNKRATPRIKDKADLEELENI